MEKSLEEDTNLYEDDSISIDSLNSSLQKIEPKILTEKEISFIKRRKFRISILISFSFYRLGNFEKAESYLFSIISEIKLALNYVNTLQNNSSSSNLDNISNHLDLIAVACSNFSLIKLGQLKFKEAVEKGKEGLDLASKLFSTTSTEYLNHLRILIAIYLKSNEYDRAKQLIINGSFSFVEKQILLAGTSFSLGDQDQALEYLTDMTEPIVEVSNKPGSKPRTPNNNSRSRVENKSMNNNELDSYLTNDIDGCEKNNIEEIKQDNKFNGSDSSIDIDEMKKNETLKRWKGYINDALIKYNLSALNSRLYKHKESETYLEEATSLINNYISEKKNEEMSIIESDNNPFKSLTNSNNQFPPISSSDDSLVTPAVFLSHVIFALAECNLMNVQFTSGLRIQSGYCMDTSYNIDQEIIDKFKKQLNKVIKPFNNLNKEIQNDESSTRINIANNSRPETISLSNLEKTTKSTLPPPELADISRPSTAFDLSRPGTGNINDSRPSTSALNPISIDKKIATEAIESYKLFCKFSAAKPDNVDIDKNFTSIADSALKVLKKKFNMDKFNQDAKIVPLNQHENDEECLKEDIVENREQQKNTDFCSIRSEILPLVSKFGRDDIGCWVQWALSISGGVGYGMVGLVSPNSTEKGIAIAGNGTNKEQDPLFLKEVRLRLIEVEAQLAIKFSDEKKYSVGDKESRILLNACLAKISVQLNMKLEARAHIDKMHHLSQSLSIKRVGMNNMQNDDIHYLALSKRFLLDYMEWKSYSTSLNADQNLMRLMELLQVAKEYEKIASKSYDYHLKRDSLKKIINIFVEINNCPARNIIEEKNNDDIPKYKSDDEDDLEYDDEGNFVIKVPIVEEKLPEIGDASALLLYNEDQINEKEKNDLDWTRLFAKARLHSFMVRYKTLSNEIITNTLENE